MRFYIGIWDNGFIMNLRKIFIFVLLITTSSAVFSKDKIIDFKQKKPLKDNEGLVVLVIDINFRISKVSLGKEGKIFPVYSFKKLIPGTQMKIIKLKTGKYFWKESTGYSNGTTYTYKFDRERTSFEVKAGKINYPGTLQFRAWSENNQFYAAHNVINNSSLIAKELEEKYKSLIAKYPLVYAGNNPDPFLEYSNELNKEN